MSDLHETMAAADEEAALQVTAAAAVATLPVEPNEPDLLLHEAQSAPAAGEEEAVGAAVGARQELLPLALDADAPSDAWHATDAPAAAGGAEGEGAAADVSVVAVLDDSLAVDAASSTISLGASPDASATADAGESEAAGDAVETVTSATDPSVDADVAADGASEVATADGHEDVRMDDAAAAERASEAESAADAPVATVESGSVEATVVDVEMAESEQPPVDGPADATEHAAVAAGGGEAAASARQSGELDERAYDPAASLSHAQDEYDPAETAYEQHGSDEYDPANPSAFGSDEYDPENPAYDPSAPSYDGGAPGSPSGADAGESEPANKRKSSPADARSPETARDAKRQRSDSHDSSRSLDARPRRSSDAEDKKGLADAAWDRLRDFQTLGEFQLNQVSRAAFASLGALPEFAQVAIVSRFTRVPLKGVRDKNGQLMRLHHEYLKEHPHVASLQPVSVFVADSTSDPGLFAFGYAPPFPLNGMSTVPVPYQKPEAATKSRASTAATSSTDEFGRTIKKAAATSPRPSSSSERAARAADPRAATAQEEPQAAAADRGDSASSSARKPFDPRRRSADENEPSAAALPDPRRASVAAAAPQSADPRRRNVASSVPPAAQASVVPAKSELYDRLPASVRGVLDAMVREGRLRETINDNVISRLNHLPEHVALRAVENFSNVDLSLIENLQGFLVGIINRVNEKAIAAERADASSLARNGGAPAAAAAASGGGGYGNDSGAVLGYPGGTAGRSGGRQGAFSRDQADGYRGGASGMSGGAASGYTQPYGAPSGMRGAGLNAAPGFAPLQQQQQPPLSMQSGYQQQQQPPPHYQAPHGILALPLSVQQRLRGLVASGAMASVDELSDKCYELLSQLSEGLANEVLTRFMNANLATVRNLSGFLIGVVKRCRQEYGFN